MSDIEEELDSAFSKSDAAPTSSTEMEHDSAFSKSDAAPTSSTEMDHDFDFSWSDTASPPHPYIPPLPMDCRLPVILSAEIIEEPREAAHAEEPARMEVEGEESDGEDRHLTTEEKFAKIRKLISSLRQKDPIRCLRLEHELLTFKYDFINAQREKERRKP